jgi:hypothetical protein
VRCWPRAQVVLTDPKDWATYLQRHLIDSPRAVALATEGALIGGLAAQGFNLDMGLVSDDAGQFDLFVHGLCWVHAERPLQHLLPLNDSDRKATAWVQQQVWFLYQDLKAYRQHPDPVAKTQIAAGFEALCATETTCEPLNRVLQGFQLTKPGCCECWNAPTCRSTTTAVRTTCGTWSKNARSAPGPATRSGDSVGTPSPASRRLAANMASHSESTSKIGSSDSTLSRHSGI